MKRIAILAAIAIVVVAALALTGDSPMKVYDSLVWLGIHLSATQPVAWNVARWIHIHLLPNYYLVP